MLSSLRFDRSELARLLPCFFTGTVGRGGRGAGINIIATLKQELGDLDRVKRIVKLVGFVNCVDGFAAQVTKRAAPDAVLCCQPIPIPCVSCREVAVYRY